MTAETLQTVVVACLAGLSVAVLAVLRVHRPRRLATAPDRRFPWGVGVLLVGLAVFGMMSFAFGGMAISLGLVSPDDADPPPARVLAVTLLGQALIYVPLAVLLVGLARREPNGLRRVGLVDRRWVRHALLGLGGLLLVLPIIFFTSLIATAITAALGEAPSEIAHELLKTMFAAPPTVRLGFVVSAVVLAPVLEELLFRGLLQTTLLNLARPMPAAPRRWLAIGVTTVVFVLAHGGVASPHALPALTVLSITLGYQYERTRSLITPIACHAGFNAVNIGLASLIVSSPPG
ncbi:MAG: JDVT-CTERM system glutamic-type intramembrane protease [Planctomycetota bacterium]